MNSARSGSYRRRAVSPPPTSIAARRARAGVNRRLPSAMRSSWSVWLRLACIAFILVYVGRIHEAIPGAGTIPVGVAVTGVLIGILFFSGHVRRFPLLFQTSALRYGVLLLGLAAISVPFALWPGGALGTLTGALKTWILCIVLPLAIISTADLRAVTRIFAVATVILVTGYILEAYFGFYRFTARQSLGFDRNDVALMAAMGIPFALAWAGTGGRWLRVTGYLLASALVAGIVATGSRGGFLAMAAVGVMFLIRSRILSGAKKLMIIALAVMLATFAGSSEYWDRIESIFTNPSEDYNFQAREGRIEVWKRGWSYATSHPVTGVGFGNFPVAEGQSLENLGYGVKWSTAHNAYILVLAELGFPGLLAFLAIFVAIVKSIRAAQRLRPRDRAPPGTPLAEAAELATVADAVGLALIAYAVGAIFLSVAYNVGFVFLVAMAVSLRLVGRGVAIRVTRSVPLRPVR